MNRQNLPLLSDMQPDMPAQITEIRMPSRAQGHELRHREGVRP